MRLPIQMHSTDNFQFHVDVDCCMKLSGKLQTRGYRLSCSQHHLDEANLISLSVCEILPVQFMHIWLHIQVVDLTRVRLLGLTV